MEYLLSLDLVYSSAQQFSEWRGYIGAWKQVEFLAVALQVLAVGEEEQEEQGQGKL